MRLHCVLLLVIFLLWEDAESALVDPDQTNFAGVNLRGVPRLLTAIKNADISKTRLKSYHAASRDTTDSQDNDNEARTANSWLSTTTGKWTNKLFLLLKTDPKVAFKRLRLGMDDVKFDDNPVFLQWLQYVNMYRIKKGRYYSFDDISVFSLLQKTKPEGELVTLFHSLRQVPGMKDFADTMQIFLFHSSSTSHKLMTDEWLKSQENPKIVFNLLRLRDEAWKGNPLLLQWLRYTELYRTNKASDSFTYVQTYPDLKKLAENIQYNLFQILIKEQMVDPTKFADMLAIRLGSGQQFLMLPKTDLRFNTLEAFTVHFAAHRGGEAVMERVKMFFANNDFEAAFAAAGKL